jgi:hypothetical protein
MGREDRNLTLTQTHQVEDEGHRCKPDRSGGHGYLLASPTNLKSPDYRNTQKKEVVRNW